MENKILNLLKKIIKEDEDTFIDITDMDDDSAAKKIMSKKDIFKKLRDKMSDKDRTPGGYEYGEIVSGQMGEELTGGQSKIDVAEPKGKITAADFKKLRDGKKSNKSEVEENIFKNMFGKKEDPEVAREKDRKENPYLGNLGYDYDDIRGWHYVGPGQGRFDNRDSEDGEMEEGNEFSGALANAKKRGEKSFEVDGKTYPVKESIQLTEDELIDLIEKIVNEQTTVPVTNKSLKSSKTENDDYIKSVTKKMQTYLKDASKGKYDMNPTQFPKGNGELAKMAKKAYTPSSAVEEYIENFAYSPGMENLQYDEIKPNEDWLEANIEGSSKTGNGAGGNAIDTGLGKKINAKRKKNLYGAEKNKSYNRVPQPVDQAGEETHNNTLDSMFKKLGESDDKKSKLINEEMEKMKHLLGYKKKTQ